MATEERTTRQKELDRIKTRIGRFVMEETYTDEQRAQEHLGNAIVELERASRELIEGRP